MLLRTLGTALVITAATLVLAYPLAYFIVRYTRRWQKVLLAAVILSFWTSGLLRAYAWMAVLGHGGIINKGLRALGLIDAPLPFLLYSPFSVVLVMTYFSLPFAVVAIYSSLEKMDWALLDAAGDLGARPLRAFWHVTLPQTMPGVVSAAALTFVPLVGMFFVPLLVGGSTSVMIAPLIANQMQAFQLGLGAAHVLHRRPHRHGRAGPAVALPRSGPPGAVAAAMARRLLIAYGVLGFAFLYLPIAFLVLFSFNDNIIPSLPFRGFTLQWYRELGFDFVLHDALYNSLVIAAITTVTSTVIGTLAAFPLVRCTFAFKRAAHAMMILPMVIPHFLMGVALLLFFAFLHLPLSRLTVVLGHIVFTVPFAILIVSDAPVRLRPLAGAGRGRPRRHAGPGVLARDPAADPARGGGRGALRVHAVDGRVPDHVLRLRPEGDAHHVHLEPAEGRHRPPGECPRQRAPGRLLRPPAGGRVAARPRGRPAAAPGGGHREAAGRGKDARGRDGIARAVHGRRSRLGRGPDVQPRLRRGRGAPAAPARGVRALHGHQRARGGAHVQEPRRAGRRTWSA